MTYGVDVSMFAGPGGAQQLDATFAQISDLQVLREDAIKMVTTPAGSLWWAPTATLDLRDFLNDSMTSADRDALSRRIELLFDDDPRMSAKCSVAFDAGARSLTVQLDITAVTGETFSLVLDFTGGTVTIVRT